jgi:drug/metabolite transporter (DMT)-like permease
MSVDKPQSPPRRVSLAGIGLVNLATFTWATNMVLGRWLRDDIGPLTLAAARFLIASAIFAALLRGRPAEERRLGPDRWLVLAMAVCGVVVFAPSLYLGLRFTTATNATLINGLGPLITGFLATLLIREPMSRRQALGAVVSLAGVALLITGGSASVWQSTQINIGDLIVLGAVTMWALYSVLGRKVMRHRSALSATAFSAFLGLPLLLVGAILESQVVSMDLRLGLIPAVLYIGVVPTVIGFLAWNEGVRRLGSSGAMVFYNTLPLYGGLIAYLFLGESLAPAGLVGGALIIGGGIWAARGRR